ncbi:hypothetical protein ACFL4L_07920 [bacterium]
MQEVHYAYVLFSKPGPYQSELNCELNALFNHVASTHELDFSNAQIHVDVESIEDPNQFDQLDIKFTAFIIRSGAMVSEYKITRQGIYADNHPHYNMVQVAWACQ